MNLMGESDGRVRGRGEEEGEEEGGWRRDGGGGVFVSRGNEMPLRFLIGEI